MCVSTVAYFVSYYLLAAGPFRAETLCRNDFIKVEVAEIDKCVKGENSTLIKVEVRSCATNKMEHAYMTCETRASYVQVPNSVFEKDDGSKKMCK